MNLICNKCNYSWDSKTKMYAVSCPKCGSKVKVNKNLRGEKDGSTGSVKGS